MDPPAIEFNSEIDLLIKHLSEAIVTASQIKAWTHCCLEYIMKCCMDGQVPTQMQVSSPISTIVMG